MTITTIATLSLFINFSILIFLFLKNPFRPSQFFILVSIFSFCIRPIATSSCDFFRPFYFFNPAMYFSGVVFANIGLTLFSSALLFTTRQSNSTQNVDPLEFNRFSNYIVILLVITDVFALVVFGQAILPGFRDSGLQATAQGSQVVFAVVNLLTVLGVASSLFCYISPRVNAPVLKAALRLLIIFLLSMLFYQRGPFISGVLLGLFICSIDDRNFIYRNYKKVILALTIVLIVAVLGRPLILLIFELIAGSAGLQNSFTFVSQESLHCGIANSPNQEHDQVWPILITYVDTFGPDYYYNLLSSIFRPFLNSEDRDRWGLFTSVDALNTYNDAKTYLDKNFGFSLSAFNYHYFALGPLFLAVTPILGVTTGFVENSVKSPRINLVSFGKIFLKYNLLITMFGAVDEQIKWLILNSVGFYILKGSFRSVRILTVMSGRS